MKLLKSTLALVLLPFACLVVLFLGEPTPERQPLYKR